MDDKTPRITEKNIFTDPMTKGQRLAAWAYLPMHVGVLPLLLSLFIELWPDLGVGAVEVNIFYYVFGALYVLVFLWRYLRGAFDVLMDNKLRCLLALITAVMINFLLSWGVQLALLAFDFDLTDVPNNDAVSDMATESYNLVLAMTVFLAPLVEEPLFRGAVFGSISRRSRFWAYAVSAVLFSLYHVWQYAVVYMDPTYLLYGLSYLPVSIALAYAYERSGSIWTPILMHMGINALAMYLL